MNSTTEIKARRVVTVTYQGGPRDGQTRRVTARSDGSAPLVEWHAEEAKAKGMRGSYNRSGTNLMVWKDTLYTDRFKPMPVVARVHLGEVKRRG